MRPSRKLRRREFIRQTGAGLAALGAAPAVLGALQTEKKLALAVIGCGGRGSGHVDDLTKRSADPKNHLAIAGVCDIYRPRLENAANRSKATAYSDYRKLLENPEIDPKFTLAAKGRMMRLPPKFMEINSGQVEEAIDAHTIQPYYTVMLADEAGMTLSAVQTPEEIVFTAEMIRA